MYELPQAAASTARVWQVGALVPRGSRCTGCPLQPGYGGWRDQRFHPRRQWPLLFSLKDETGQMRCAMFRRAASLLNFAAARRRPCGSAWALGVYEPRGELQLVVESMRPQGRGRLFEQFFKLKAKLEQEGLFDPARKKAAARTATRHWPCDLAGRGSPARCGDGPAAAGAPHTGVTVAPASVQGESAPRELVPGIAPSCMP
jgi:exodeoxyribonuclease VII large subunit